MCCGDDYNVELISAVGADDDDAGLIMAICGAAGERNLSTNLNLNNIE
jgi:hypothetical protein